MNKTTLDFIKDSNNFFIRGFRKESTYCKKLLISLKTALKEKRNEILVALYEDLRKSENEAILSEYIPLMDSLNYMIKNVKKLSRGKLVNSSLVNFPGYGKILPEPYGTVLIISTWNYPLLLSIDPLIGAIASGNNVILKMSPNTPNTTRILAQILTQVFQNKDCICDENSTLEELLVARYDYIFFTGGRRTGKLIAEAAAKTFTPVTLEMGGKSPCIIDDSSNLKLAAKRVAWGKFMNAGQTCVAPDYLLVQAKVKDKFLNLLREQVKIYFGENPEESRDYARIINEANFERLSELIKKGKLITGGEKNSSDLYIAPTIIDEISLSDDIMKEEIFGPILPVLTVNDYQEACSVIRSFEKPLAAYYFSKNSSRINSFLKQTSSGGVAINDVVMHLSSKNLPFGGVGYSGMGSYHGKQSFLTFSHEKSVLFKNGLFDIPLRYPKYVKWKSKVLEFLSKTI